MTREEAIEVLAQDLPCEIDEDLVEAMAMAIKALEQQPCEMTVNEYRNRLMDAFHNADCDELIAVVVRPEESEFKQLEWLLKNHYHKQKQQPCEDAVSRQAVIKLLSYDWANRPAHKAVESVRNLPPVTPKEKTAEWYEEDGCEGACEGYMSAGVICSQCGELLCGYIGNYDFCPNCGARMQEVEENG